MRDINKGRDEREGSREEIGQGITVVLGNNRRGEGKGTQRLKGLNL